MKTFVVLILMGKALVAGNLAYTEKHKATISPDGFYHSIETTYTNEKNEEFASLKSDFSKDKLVPDYQFQNSNIQLTESVKKSEDGKKLLVDITEKGKNRKFEMPVVERAVMGQGFHNYILAHFDELKEKSQEVNFIIPRKKDFFRFVIKKEKVSGDEIFFSLRPSSFILKAFVPKLVVSYHMTSKKLLSFEGVTNIEDKNENAYNAFISFSYLK